MRPSCLFCARKHLAQAEVLMSEALKGYPRHAWLAVGHLAEAEDELLEKFPELAGTVRDHRLRYMATIRQPPLYMVPTLDLLDMVEVVQSGVDAEGIIPPSLVPEAQP